MIYLWLTSLSFAQQPAGLICQFSEPFYTMRYRFERQILSIEALDFETYQTQVTHLATERKIDKTIPNQPKYLIYKKATKEVLLTAIENNQGSDGMSDEVYVYQATYKGSSGGCQKLEEVGTHEVFAMAIEKKPWLSLRSSAASEAAIIGKLKDGNEVQIIESKGRWRKIKVISGYEAGQTGWVYGKLLRQIRPK